MFIRYKFWDKDPVGSYTVSVPGVAEGRLCFTDKDKGVLDVRNRLAIEHLLKKPYYFEVAYDLYGFSFDANNLQVDEDVAGVVSEVEPKDYPEVKPRRRKAKVA